MGLFSCLGCGSSDQEKQDAPARTEQRAGAVSEGKPKPADEATAPPTSASDAAEQRNQTGEASRDAADFEKEDISDSVPSANPADQSHAEQSQTLQTPEQSFGLQHMISEDGRQPHNREGSQLSKISLDPEATEEDRWFEEPFPANR